MHKQLVDAEVVFRCDIMDKTLADYINRIANLEKQLKSPQQEIIPEKTEHLVYPEPNSIDSDEKRNPYSKV